MFRAAVLTHALHPAFEDAEQTFNRFGVDGAIDDRNVLFLRVIDVAVAAAKLEARALVEMRFVGDQAAVTAHVRLQDAADCIGVQLVGDHETASAAS
jgi:hypothetical protein